MNLIWILENDDDAVAAEEHLGDEAVAVDGRGLLLALARLRHLRPHLLHALQYHVAVPVKRLHTAKQLFVTSQKALFGRAIFGHPCWFEASPREMPTAGALSERIE